MQAELALADEQLAQLSIILDQEVHPFAAATQMCCDCCCLFLLIMRLRFIAAVTSAFQTLQLSFILDQLEQVQEGHPFAGRPVVILAERSKEEMDALVSGILI